MSGSSPLQPFPAGAHHLAHPATDDQVDNPNQPICELTFSEKQQELVLIPRSERKFSDSGIVKSWNQETSLQQQALGFGQHSINEEAEVSHDVGSGCDSPTSTSSNSKPDLLCSFSSHCSTGPVSNHDSSVYSSDNTVEGGGGDVGGEGGGGGGGGRGAISNDMLPLQAKSTKCGVKWKRGKCSSKRIVEEVTENSFTIPTPSYSYKWFTGLPNKLNNKKNLKAREKIVWGNRRKKSSTKLRSEIEILPNFTEPSNERVTKMRVRLTVENARLDEYECVAIVDVSLYNPHTEEKILQRQEKRKLTGGLNYVQFFTTLGLQERIDRSTNKLLDLTIRSELQFQRVLSEDCDGYVYVEREHHQQKVVK